MVVSGVGAKIPAERVHSRFTGCFALIRCFFPCLQAVDCTGQSPRGLYGHSFVTVTTKERCIAMYGGLSQGGYVGETNDLHILTFDASFRKGMYNPSALLQNVLSAAADLCHNMPRYSLPSNLLAR